MKTLCLDCGMGAAGDMLTADRRCPTAWVSTLLRTIIQRLSTKATWRLLLNGNCAIYVVFPKRNPQNFISLSDEVLGILRFEMNTLKSFSICGYSFQNASGIPKG